MAFVPSAKDFEESSQGFIPSAEHFEEKQPEKKSFDRLSQIPNNLWKSLKHEGVDAANSLNSIANAVSSGVYNILPASLRNPNYKKNEMLPEVQGYEDIKNSAEAWAASIAPYLMPAAGVGKLGFKGATALGSKLSPSLARLTGYGAGTAGKNLIQDLLGGEKIGNVHKILNQETRDLAAKNLKETRSDYKRFFQDAENAGFRKNAYIETPGISIAGQGGKVINNPKFLEELKDLHPQNDSLGKMIGRFENKPTLDAAHKLQSKLGETGANYSTSSVGSEREMGKEYGLLRDRLKNLISNEFERSGNPELASEYNRISNKFKEKVLPYRGSAIKKILQEKNNPNIHKLLTSEEPEIQKVFNDLSPKSKDLVTAKFLSGAMKNLTGNNVKFNAEKFMNLVDTLERGGIEKVGSEGNVKRIRELAQIYEKQKRFAPLKYSGIAGAVGAVGGASANKIYNLLNHIGGD